ncbi:MAG: PhoH family protein [Candidatus Omnitrophica bacterium]|nr:PhoH family protein [Candidatus Omnitrophota bacterium]MBU4488761.1 PhoH family protein [Candidatus Omnitrophota bacterium]MCG2705858.1 PhoH family protein [Candidatus Omnitrophota bacterium]
MVKQDLTLKNDSEAKLLFGPHDQNLKLIEKGIGVTLYARGLSIAIEGPKKEVDSATRLLNELLITIREGGQIKKHEVLYAIHAIKENKEEDVHSIYLDKIEVSAKRQFVFPRSKGQKEYVEAIKRNDIVFGVGPAGTGKTYLAMAMAVNALKKQLVSRIILARPAVEAGESLGFLPGDLYEKVTPYLRPLYDALYDMVEADKIRDYTERGIIEVVPLAYMRGRTLNNSFIILDEAQNSTSEQMKMFLTRLGFDSKTVITGDITQSDLPSHKESGLKQVINILKDIEGIRFVFLSGEDVVRHELVQEIIKAYERADSGKG